MAVTVQGYRNAIDAVAKRASESALRALAAVDITDPGAEQAFMDILAQAGYGSAEGAAQVSCIFYDTVREEQIGQRMGAGVHSGYHRSKTEKVVEQLFDEYYMSADINALMRGCADHIDSCARMGARGCMGYNSRRDSTSPLWASVPGGNSPCDYCTQIAAAGYYAKNPIQPIHDHCKCSSLPNWDSKKAASVGYDQHEWEDRYYEMIKDRAK